MYLIQEICIHVYIYVYICIYIYIGMQREIMVFIGKPKGRSMMISNRYAYICRLFHLRVVQYIYIYIHVYVYIYI